METTRATCNNWVLTFVKRGLSDDLDPLTWEEYEISNRKLTWNPWSLCFITASAGDILDKDDDIVWTGHQTYTGAATYKWALTTEKWVQYPHFDNVAALEAYASPFGWMFAVVDSTGELYRYNAVTEEWSVVESSTPTNPEMADDETIWTVRIATDAEFEAWTDTGSQWEYLVATPSQIQSVSPEVDVKVFELDSASDLTTWQAIFDFYKNWWVPIIKNESSYRFSIYYMDQDSTNLSYLKFFRLQISNWEYVSSITINYSWTTVTSINIS